MESFQKLYIIIIIIVFIINMEGFIKELIDSDYNIQD